MNRFVLPLLLLLAGCAAGSGDGRSQLPPAGVVSAPTAAGVTAVKPAVASHTFVVVHGAGGGGWAWGAVDSLVTAAGHTLTRPTLTGLGERVHLARPGTGLDTHVTDVVNHLVFEELEDVILVGHSYGGMVAMGVAHRTPERIRRVVLIDAFLPRDGESAVDAVRGTALEEWITGLVDDAAGAPIVPSWIRADDPMPGDVPQPLRTFTEPVRMENPAAASIPGTYILTVAEGSAPGDDLFAAFADRAESLGWDVEVLRSDHNPQNSAREAIAAVLLRVAR